MPETDGSDLVVLENLVVDSADVGKAGREGVKAVLEVGDRKEDVAVVLDEARHIHEFGFQDL